MSDKDKLSIARANIIGLIDLLVDHEGTVSRGYCNHPGDPVKCIDDCAACSREAQEARRTKLIEEYINF